MATKGDAKVETGNTATADVQLMAKLQRAVDICLALLPDGNPFWSKDINRQQQLVQSATELKKKAHSLTMQGNLQVIFSNSAKGVEKSSKPGFVQATPEFKNIIVGRILGPLAEAVFAAKTAFSAEMGYILIYILKYLDPDLHIQSCTLRCYNSDFLIINNTIVLHLFAHGFNLPVIFPIADLEKNLLLIKDHLPQYSRPIPKPDLSYEAQAVLEPGFKFEHSSLLDARITDQVKQKEREARKQERLQQLLAEQKRLDAVEAVERAAKKKAEEEAKQKAELEAKQQAELAAKQKAERDEVVAALKLITNREFGREEKWFYEESSKTYRCIFVPKDATEIEKVCSFFKGKHISISHEKKQNKRRFIIKDNTDAVAKIKALVLPPTVAAGPDNSEVPKASKQDLASMAPAESKTDSSAPSQVQKEQKVPAVKITEPLAPEAALFLDNRISRTDIELLTGNPRLYYEVIKPGSRIGRELLADPVRFFHTVIKCIAKREADATVKQSQDNTIARNTARVKMT